MTVTTIRAAKGLEQLCVLVAGVEDGVKRPLQDVLDCDSTARFNRPGTVVGNWAWRLRREQLTPALAAEYRALIALFGRLA